MTSIRIKRQAVARPRATYVVEMNIDELPEEASLEYEPHTILQQKIEFLMEELGCSEREANRMVFGLLGPGAHPPGRGIRPTGCNSCAASTPAYQSRC